MKEGNLFTSFVQEYREQTGETLQEWAASSTVEEIEETIANIADNLNNWDMDDMDWGPSSPFAPTEAKLWAQRWMLFIQEASDEILAVTFPYTLDIQTGKSTLQKQWASEDLQAVIAQAECAERHDAQMIVEALWT